MNCQMPPAPDARPRAGVEAALDHRDVQQILRQPFTRQHLLEQLAVAPGPPQPAGHDGVPLGVVLEVVEVTQDLGVPAHGKVGQRQPAQPLRIGRRRRLLGDDGAVANAARRGRRRCRPTHRAGSSGARRRHRRRPQRLPRLPPEETPAPRTGESRAAPGSPSRRPPGRRRRRRRGRRAVPRGCGPADQPDRRRRAAGATPPRRWRRFRPTNESAIARAMARRARAAAGIIDGS